MNEDGQPSRYPRDPSKPDNATADVAWSITSHLLAGMLVWGGLGALVDRWVGHFPLFLVIGLVVGVAGALYLSIQKINRLS